MDAQFSNRRFDWSGTKLGLILIVALSLAAIVLDWSADRLFSLSMSLTLPLWASAAIVAGLGYWSVPRLRALKMGQSIREDGPQAHLKKAGTPTMGGIFLVPSAIAIALIWAGLSPAISIADGFDLAAVAALTLAYGFIGWLDDWQILRRKSNQGISPGAKLALQIGFAVLFCLWLVVAPQVFPVVSARDTAIALPLNWILPLGWFFWPFAGFVLVAESNATNLTDGLDGLMAGTGAIAFLGFAALVAPTHPGLAIFCACFSGSCLGFLGQNRNPARVFMGDTGSLALGGALAAVAIVSNQLFALLVVGGLFFIETLSVMAQVGYYKATKDERGVGKRLLKMAPLHHHLELSGWSELRVVGVLYLASGLLALGAIALS